MDGGEEFVDTGVIPLHKTIGHNEQFMKRIERAPFEGATTVAA
jgi:hypothetical protein